MIGRARLWEEVNGPRQGFVEAFQNHGMIRVESDVGKHRATVGKQRRLHAMTQDALPEQPAIAALLGTALHSS